MKKSLTQEIGNRAKTIIIVQARIKSSRLPGKVILKVQNEPLIIKLLKEGRFFIFVMELQFQKF